VGHPLRRSPDQTRRLQMCLPKDAGHIHRWMIWRAIRPPSRNQLVQQTSSDLVDGLHLREVRRGRRRSRCRYACTKKSGHVIPGVAVAEFCARRMRSRSRRGRATVIPSSLKLLFTQGPLPRCLFVKAISGPRDAAFIWRPNRRRSPLRYRGRRNCSRVVRSFQRGRLVSFGYDRVANLNPLVEVEARSLRLWSRSPVLSGFVHTCREVAALYAGAQGRRLGGHSVIESDTLARHFDQCAARRRVGLNARAFLFDRQPSAAPGAVRSGTEDGRQRRRVA
jgi:hypothetical protein